MAAKKSYNKTSFIEQVNLDQKRYSRYVCDSRAIPNEIDGMKPVQRRILWTMWNSVAKNNFTKTVKVAGLVMGYHPHGDVSIQDAISAMTQDFTFANNYPLIQGEGTFGDVLDPKAIASPRYTEVKLSKFAGDVGLFESIQDIEYITNYDDTNQEPVYFVPKVPVVLLNGITGIATGFRCSIPAHRLTDIVDAMIAILKRKKPGEVVPWYKDYAGDTLYSKNESGNFVHITGFGFTEKNKKVYLTCAPQNWNREKVIDYLEQTISNPKSPLRDYIDYSTDKFDIELISKKGQKFTVESAKELLNKKNNETVVMNVITSEGRLINTDSISIIKRFLVVRKEHLVERFKRLSKLEKEKIDKNSELIRFIEEKWNQKVITIKNKQDFEKKLKTAKFVYYEWLSSIPVYRMTKQEVEKSKMAIAEAKKQFKMYKELYTESPKLNKFIINEITELKNKWDHNDN
ncbi:MAG: DNA gyrase subunit A [bacterium]|nr:DNA gyrase subunit A [bacterium]